MRTTIVSTRTTFDGATVHLHADGTVSGRLEVMRGRLATDIMWRVWADVCLYEYGELAAYFAQAKAGKLRWQRPRGPGRMDPGILRRSRARLEHDRRPWPSP